MIRWLPGLVGLSLAATQVLAADPVQIGLGYLGVAGTRSTLSLMKRTDPSPRVTFTPPVCRLRAATVLLGPLSPLMQGRFSCGWLSHQPTYSRSGLRLSFSLSAMA